MAALLEIADLDIRFGTRQIVAMDELAVGEAEIVGLAGESGSGKSMTTLAVLGLAGTVGATVTGSIKLNGRELTGLPDRELRDIRGRRIAAIFQSPSMAFNPVFRVGHIALRAAVLLADEPTSALDVTVQAEVLELIRELRRREGMAVLFISHDLAVVAELCDRVAVMRNGLIVEQGPVDQIMSAPRHTYTADLLRSVPTIRGRG